jgi:hypothetical protein
MDFISIRDAERLIALHKYVKDGDEEAPSWVIDFEKAISTRKTLVTHSADDPRFLVDIKQMPFNLLKLSLHFQLKDQLVLLLRVDYGGTHQNPMLADALVPPEVAQFAGKYFGPTEHHIHRYVPAYPNLVWAVPLSHDPFMVKEVNNQASLRNAILAFCNRIGLETSLNVTLGMPIPGQQLPL